MKPPKSNTGFTLIEILLYTGLFSVVIGGLLLITHGILGGSVRLQSDVVINEEGIFIIRKIYWALAGASDIAVPSAGRLEVTNLNFPAAENPLVFELNSGNLILSRGAGVPARLNSDNVEITALAFSKITGAGGAPDGVSAQFTIKSALQSKDFNLKRYLRY